MHQRDFRHFQHEVTSPLMTDQYDRASWASNSIIPGLIGAGDFTISWWVKGATIFPAGSGNTPSCGALSSFREDLLSFFYTAFEDSLQW